MNNYRKTIFRFFFVFSLFVLLQPSTSFAQNSQTPTNEQKIPESIIAAVTGSIFGAIFGVATSWLTTKFEYKKDLKLLKDQIQLERQEKIQREISRLKQVYLSPLRLASQELTERLEVIFWQKRNKQPDQNNLKHWFTYIKNDAFNNTHDFRNHVNGQAHFAATSIYLTAVYFAHSVKIREQLPFTNFREYNEQLIERIEAVRKAWSGEYSIWEEAQDSIGRDLIKSDGTILTFREFCNELMDPDQHPWYLRLLDYYRDFDLQSLDKVESVKKSLNRLILFLEKTDVPTKNNLDITNALLDKLG